MLMEVMMDYETEDENDLGIFMEMISANFLKLAKENSI